MYELQRAMTNAKGETKQAGALVDESWLGNLKKLLERGWVKPVKRKPVLKTDKPLNEKEADNG